MCAALARRNALTLFPHSSHLSHTRSPCHLRTCGEPHVVIKHRGRCPSEVNTCQSQRAAVLGSRRTASPMDILPDCSEKDPNFWKPVQCHQATEYCWCVMAKDGKVVPGSSVRHRKPDCERLSRRRSNRRSARKGTGSSQGKMCTTSERLTFVFNLLAIFKSEFGRAQPAGKSVSSVTERRVINWKFRQLDANRDNGLRRKEVQDLKRMIKKLVQPRACAKLFARTTDANGDQIISRHEWNMYFKLAPRKFYFLFVWRCVSRRRQDETASCHALSSRSARAAPPLIAFLYCLSVCFRRVASKLSRARP